MSKSLRIMIGLIISGLCLWLAFRNFVWSDLQSALSQANWWMFAPVAIVYVGAHFLRSLRWSFLLEPVKKLSSPMLFPLIMFGFLVNNILPARAGEVARAFVAHKKFEIPTSTVLGSVAMERLSDLIGLLTVMGFSLFVITADKLPVKKVGIMLVVGFGVITLALLVVRFFHMKSRYTFLNNLVLGFSSFQSPRITFFVALLSMCIWSSEALCLTLASHAFHLNLNFFQACALESGISLGVMIPASPGYIGTYEYFGTQTLRLLGYGAEVAVPFLVSFHFFQMLVCFFLGLPTLIKFGIPSKKETLTKDS